MMNQALRDSLLLQAEQAYKVLTEQASLLLKACMTYTDAVRGEGPASLLTPSFILKFTELGRAQIELGSLAVLLAEEIIRWKNEAVRFYKPIAVETEILNEMVANIEAIMLFLIREDAKLGDFTLSRVKKAQADLAYCNRLL